MKRDVTLWPLIAYQGRWTIPDPLLLDVWGKLIETGRNEIVFYDGTVQTGLQWLQYVKSPHQFVVFAVSESDEDFVGVGWLSNMQYGTAEAHFSFFDRYVPGAGEKVIKFWGEVLPLKVIYGYTPESYETVQKLLKRWGFKTVGTIPDFCNMVYKNIREGAVVLYRQMEDLDVQT